MQVKKQQSEQDMQQRTGSKFGIGKDPDAGRDWGQEEKGMTEDEMAGWHHRLNGRELEWTPGVGDGQGITLNPNFYLSEVD